MRHANHMRATLAAFLSLATLGSLVGERAPWVKPKAKSRRRGSSFRTNEGGPRLKRATGPGSINCKAEITALWNARRFGEAADLAEADILQCEPKVRPAFTRTHVKAWRELHAEFPS